MSRFNFVILACLLVNACSITAPYVDRKRNAGQGVENLYVGKSTPKNPAICYNSWFATVDEVKAMAVEECKKQESGNDIIIKEHTTWSCSLFSPNHLYFECIN